jgi:hypothetical protein
MTTGAVLAGLVALPAGEELLTVPAEEEVLPAEVDPQAASRTTAAAPPTSPARGE